MDNNIYISNLLKDISIIDFVKLILNLKKIGDNFFALCPFHKENNPSFVVNELKKKYHCFGCGAHGNIIDFIKNYYNINFYETIKLLNIDIKNKYNLSNIKKNKYFFLYSKMNEICNIYKKNLIENINNKYLLKFISDKKWDINIIKFFNIGFSYNNVLINNFKNLYLLKNLGLIIKYKNIHIDKFNLRIIFPIKNTFGNIIGIGGRRLDDKYPKYINSKDNKIFKKRNILYGLAEIKEKHFKINKLLLVEGYTDVISLHFNGIDYALSSLGTSTTEEQIKILFNNSNRIIFCYDGDKAGRVASWKMLNKILCYITDDREVKFLFLPKNEDPDSLIRKIGKTKFENMIDNSMYFYDFFFKVIKKNINISNIYEKIKLIRLIKKFLKKIPGKLIKFFLKKEININFNLYNRNINNNFNKKITFNKNNINPLKLFTILLIQNPNYYYYINNKKELKYIIEKYKCNILIEIFKIYKNNKIFNTYKLLNLLKKNIFFEKILYFSKYNHMINIKYTNIVFIDILKWINKFFIKNIQEYLIKKDKKIGLNKIEKNKLWLLNLKLFKK
ncbi:DNA primase [endosymbiont of Sipalinus gigas]|uniref:DNA primase n=1 Tax=endosymbiont of Sipalinus gigas TaxID=1972134 RepID=UPI000DC6FFA6|nr:DNA primase [endosymbiont of Sipalinus gigas]BBA85343.1 DNA primase [endosymbiont of Sipalinus gigas]